MTISDPCAINTPQIVVVTLSVLYGDGNELHVPSEYETIQAAIDDCNEGDTVVIASGTYTGSGNRDLNFKGKAITVRSTNPDNPAVVAATIIDCNGSESDNHCGFSFHNNEDSNSVLSGITITSAYGSFGGAILCQNSSPSIINCNFVNNFVSGGGGGIHNSYSSPTLINCVFRNNSSEWIAGALRNHTSSPLVINCLFTGNSANYGGAIQNQNISSNPTLINCTFTGNTASSWAGGILNAGGTPTASPVLTNCISWGNSDGGGTDESAQIYGGSPIINYSCVQGWTGGFGGTGNIGSNPCFADVDNPDPNLWNLRLKPDSPCIDEGDNNAVSLAAADLDGHPRIINGDCDDVDVIDMGAYEFNYTYMGDMDYNCSVDFFDFSIFGQAWETKAGDPGWDWACDISGPPDDYIDWRDVAVICENWLVSIRP